MEAFVLDTSRLVGDVIAYIAQLKSTFQSTGNPINDDDTTLQKLCVKFETILRHEQKEKYSMLGYRKDYWNFIVECIPKDDGVKYVQAVPQMKTAQGKGRCFIRYALAEKTLADTVQRLMVNKNSLSSWYRPDAIFRNPSLSTALVNKLYDLNDVEFDLPSAGYDLDISWPAFSRRRIRDGSTSGRRNSVSSMASVDFRNERQDPLVGLATEIASLEEFFNSEFSEVNPGKNDAFDNVSISASNLDTPAVSELTLKISHIHQQALKWRSTVNSTKAVLSQEMKKAQDDKQFAIRESELKTKQMMEKFSNLAKVSTEQSDKKCSELAGKLSAAEKALQERDSELKQLRNEVHKSVVDSSTAQKSAIELEKQLTASERKRSELGTEMESLKQKLKSKEQLEIEFDLKQKQLKERMGILESKDNEYKESISELQGNLRAKEVALQSIQESFEKLNGMVFGSFEELETEMKQRLVEKEKGLQNQTDENRKLELNVDELQKQIREKRTKLSETKSQLEDLQMSYKEIQSSNEKMEEQLKERDGQLQECEGFMKELGEVLMEEEITDNDTIDGMATNNQAYLIERCRSLFDQVQSLQVQIVNISKMLKEAEERFEKKEQDVQERNAQFESLQAAKNKMSEEFDVLKSNKDDLDTEKAVIEEELKTALSSLDDMQSELLQARQSNTERENELNDLRNTLTKQTDLTQEYEQQINSFKDECQVLRNTNEKLQLDLSKAQDKVTLFESENVDLKEELNVLKQDLRTQTDEKLGMEDELGVAKQQLESANEGRIRAEHAQVKAQEELQNLQCMMEQEVAALKFQLSSETIKYETEIKVLSEQSQESARYKDRSVEQEEAIADLETKLKIKSDEWQNEKRKYVNEIKHLRHEVQLLKNALDGNKQKITTLENDLLLTTKQLDEERARQKDMKRKIVEANEQKTKDQNELKGQMKDMEKDMRELKTKIVTLTREKAEFWKKADDLEHELKLKASDRWVEDSEVKHCTNCKSEFSFLVRKHHCRLCGRIFCHSCVNNWVKTAHSSKLKRVCDYCLANDKQLKPQKGPGKRQTDSEEDLDETMSDISIGASPRKGTRSSTLQSVSDEDIATASQTNKDKTDQEKNSNEKPRAASSPIQEDKTKGTNESKPLENNTAQSSNSSSEYSSFATASTVSNPASPREGVTSPVGEGFEVIDPHEEINEVLESRVVISDTDYKEDLLIPAVNDEQDVSREFIVSAGTRYVLPVMVATPGAILCWSFRTAYKSIIFGLAYKDSEKQKDENIETLFPLARYSSNVIPVEGEWKTACHGVYLLVFDNTYSRFTSKHLTCHLHVKRKPSLLHPSS